MISDQTPSEQSASKAPDTHRYADRCYRSPAALASGVLLLVLVVWLTADAVIRGSGRMPLAAVAAFVCCVPLLVAFTFRPAVFAGQERLRVRNPFRTITMSWRSVELLRAGYSCEVVAEGTKYQLFSIPVSIRARKGASRHNERIRAGRPPSRGLFGRGTVASGADLREKRAPSDNSMDELRELARVHGADGEQPAPQAPVTVRWAYEVMIPAVLGALALAFLVAT